MFARVAADRSTGPAFSPVMTSGLASCEPWTARLQWGSGIIWVSRTGHIGRKVRSFDSGSCEPSCTFLEEELEVLTLVGFPALRWDNALWSLSHSLKDPKPFLRGSQGLRGDGWLGHPGQPMQALGIPGTGFGSLQLPASPPLLDPPPGHKSTNPKALRAQHATRLQCCSSELSHVVPRNLLEMYVDCSCSRCLELIGFISRAP